ncbi:interleukin-6-like [Salarias fasciatus]|uniref:interleukin-6-like n=1 Tax=Salarias fasciatus TaxID=181472 RepID=UPI001176F684|nr:interleukin-6-like [Salarias fasciatus]
MISISYPLSALMLAALLLCASGAPTPGAPTTAPAGDSSGEEEGEATSDLLSTWKALAGIAKQHKKQFEDEFHKSVTILESYKTSSFPIKCPEFNFSREACYHRLAKGLQVYTVLLRHVEREYPNNLILSAARLYSSVLIQGIKEKMRRGDQVSALTSGQEEQLLREFDTPDRYHRKMTAHSILHHLKVFLADGTRAIFKRERAWAGRKAVTFHAANS